MGLENVTSIFGINLVNVGMKLETKLQYFDIYLHDKNILDYAPLLVGSGKFIIFHIEVTLMHIFFGNWGCTKSKMAKFAHTLKIAILKF